MTPAPTNPFPRGSIRHLVWAYGDDWLDAAVATRAVGADSESADYVDADIMARCAQWQADGLVVFQGSRHPHVRKHYIRGFIGLDTLVNALVLW